MNKSSAFLWVLLFWARSALAQETVPPPVAPLVNNLPAAASWTISCVPKKIALPPLEPNAVQARTAFRYLKEIEVEKMGGNRHDIYHWSDGVTSEMWFYDGVVLFTPPNSSEVHVFSHEVDPRSVSDYAKTDFPEFAWLSLQSYGGIQSHDQHTCYWFHEIDQSRNRGISSKAPVTRDAWIDIKTKLPVAIDDVIEVKTYSFGSRVPQEAVLTPPFAQALQKYKTAEQAFKQKYEKNPSKALQSAPAPN